MTDLNAATLRTMQSAGSATQGLQSQISQGNLSLAALIAEVQATNELVSTQEGRLRSDKQALQNAQSSAASQIAALPQDKNYDQNKQKITDALSRQQGALQQQIADDQQALQQLQNLAQQQSAQVSQQKQNLDRLQSQLPQAQTTDRATAAQQAQASQQKEQSDAADAAQAQAHDAGAAGDGKPTDRQQQQQVSLHNPSQSSLDINYQHEPQNGANAPRSRRSGQHDD